MKPRPLNYADPDTVKPHQPRDPRAGVIVLITLLGCAIVFTLLYFANLWIST